MKSIAPGVEATEERMEDAYKLEGIVLDDMDMIGSMDTELAGTSKVIPIKYVKKSGAYASSAGGYLFTREEFDELSQQVDSQVERICAGDLRRQDRHPSEKKKRKKTWRAKHRTSCKYCSYKSICMFDTAFPGCWYERV